MDKVWTDFNRKLYKPRKELMDEIGTELSRKYEVNGTGNGI